MTEAAGRSPSVGTRTERCPRSVVRYSNTGVDPLVKQPGRRVVAPVRGRWISETFASAMLVVSLLNSKQLQRKFKFVNANPNQPEAVMEELVYTALALVLVEEYVCAF